MIPSDLTLDWARPHTAKLRGTANVLEERGLWLTGHLVKNRDVRFELSFEMCHELKCLPDTFVTYLGMWQGKKNIFEFCMGQVMGRPDPQEYQDFVVPILLALSDHYPLIDNNARFRAMRKQQLAQSGVR